MTRRAILSLSLALLSTTSCAKSDADWTLELSDRDPFVRALAALALSEQAPERADRLVPVLLETIDQVALRLRPEAEAALARIAPAGARALLDTVLEGEFITDDRRNAALAALRAAGPSAVPALIEALRGPQRERAAGLGVLLVEAGESAAPALAGLLVADDPWLSGYAAFLLGEIGPRARAALPALRAASAHPDRAVADEALRSIARIEGAEPLPAPGGERAPGAR